MAYEAPAIVELGTISDLTQGPLQLRGTDFLGSVNDALADLPPAGAPSE